MPPRTAQLSLSNVESELFCNYRLSALQCKEHACTMQRECKELSAFNCRKQSVCQKGEGEWCLHLQPANPSNSFTRRNQPDDNSESHKDKEPKEGHIFKTSEKHCLRKQQGFLTQRMREYPPLCIQALLHHKKEAQKNRKAYADPDHLPCLYAYFFPKIRI